MLGKVIASGELLAALVAFIWLLHGMRPDVALEVFQSSKGALAGVANVRPRLVRLRRGEIGGSLGVDSDGRSWQGQHAESGENRRALRVGLRNMRGSAGQRRESSPESSAVDGALPTAALEVAALDMAIADRACSGQE